MTIPKRIFYVWGAGEPLKEQAAFCIQTWKDNLPDYDIIQIDEDSTEYFNFRKELESNRWFKTVYDKKMWAYVADYIRIKTLFDNGGIYLDTDVTVVKSFDDVLDNPAFVGMQDSSLDGWRDLVEPAILGSEQHNYFLGQIVQFYDTDIWTKPIYSMPDIFNHFLESFCPMPFPKKEQQQILKFTDITIYPEKYFIPFRYSKDFKPWYIKDETHTVHWWNASWLKPETLDFLKNKHKGVQN